MTNPTNEVGPSTGKEKKSNQIALILSGLMPGLGQFYNEDWAKGAAFFIAYMILTPILLPESYLDILTLKIHFSTDLSVRLLLLGTFQIFCVWDADRSVKIKNKTRVHSQSQQDV